MLLLLAKYHSSVRKCVAVIVVAYIAPPVTGQRQTFKEHSARKLFARFSLKKN